VPRGDDDVLARAIRRGEPELDDATARLARARAAQGLFGTAEPVRVGRYELERQLGAGAGGVVFVANDPELSRRVALKLIRTRGPRERALAEGHALARLAHPNVVPIFDVGTHDDQIYLVMELVEGATLREWIATPRTTREIIRVYREAGAGLAAAHRAGFVHRDFKPDNAIVGTDGRARVVDFGLVAGEGESRPRAREVAGTPRYMPPEQASGGELTPAADQYAFCASLREAIIARTKELPRWLDAICTRGLAARPEERFPSMDALLAALARDPAKRVRIAAIAIGVIVVAVAAFAIGRDTRAPCDGGRAEIDAIWSGSARRIANEQLSAMAAQYPKQVRESIVGGLDRYAAAWQVAHRDACTAHRAGTQSGALFDRRMRCLDRARASLDAVAQLARTARSEQVAALVIATTELPLLARCADPTVLVESVAPPSEQQREAVTAIDRELAAREVDIAAGRADEVRAAIDALVVKARAIGYAPVLARALRLAGVAAIAADARADAIAPLAEATTLAFAAGDDELAIEAFARRAWAEGTSGKQNALAELPVVEAIATRLPPGARAARALLANNVGGVELALGNRERARAAFERAIAERAGVRGPSGVELAQVPANLALAVDDPALRDTLFAQAIAALTEAVGATHPITLDVRIMAAKRRDDAARAEVDLAAACTAVAELHPERGATIGECAFELGWLALDRDDNAAARRWFAAVVDASTRGGDAGDAALARAHVTRLEGDPARAAAELAAHRDAIGALDAQPWWRRNAAAEADLGRALAARDAGDHATATAMLERARAELAILVENHPSASRSRRLARVIRELAITNRAGSR
jgi:hypothetical protein